MNESNVNISLKVTEYTEYKASVLIWKIFSPLLIVLGTIGNLLSILVLTRKNMRKSTVSIYLITLSIIDILVLYTGLLRHAIRYHTQLDVREMSPISCKINTWLVYFTLDMSVWLLVAVTGERIVSVWLPHRVKYACTNVSAVIVITVIGLVLITVNSHFLYGIGESIEVEGNVTTVSKCSTLWDDYKHFLNRVWPWVDMCFFCLIPFTVLIIGNISIILKVCSTRKVRRRFESSSMRGNAQQNQAYNKKTSSMTVMLLCLNMVFLLCTSPISVYLIGEPYWVEDLNNHGLAQHALIWAVVNILMYTNNSVNFLLYCLSGTRFREELVKIFMKKNRIRPQVSLTNVNGTRQKRNIACSDNNDFIDETSTNNVVGNLLTVPVSMPTNTTVIPNAHLPSIPEIGNKNIDVPVE